MTTFRDEELIAYLEGHELEESRKKAIEGALVSDTAVSYTHLTLPTKA